ncbi:MAG: hypothetical protein LBV38_05670 [Alistipes sp.]|jgi:hypothetical protein|nr:hypothetical protein [Alistipes sp.]
MTTMLVHIPLQGDPVSAVTFIREVLGSPMGSFAFILGVMILAGWLIHFVTKHTSKFNIEHGAHKEKMGKFEDKIDGINRDVSYIRGTIDILMKKDNPNPTVQAHSPISLTDFGKKLAIEMELEERIERNWDKISNYLDSNLPKSSLRNAYDIQQFCIDTASVSLNSFFGTEDLDEIKNYAFRNGNPLIFYGNMIGVMIRDVYFRHKGISVDEVDERDPMK